MNNTESLVLVPGFVCDARVWRDQVAALSVKRTVQVADHGTAASLGAMAERILAAAPQRFALAGHSMGGRVALEVLALAPERVTRVALMDTGCHGLAPGAAGERERAHRYGLREIARRDGMRAMAQEWAPGMVHPRRLTDRVLMDEIHQMTMRASLAQFEAQLDALLARPDRTALLPTITVPTLVLCGNEDSWSPMARHVEMAGLIPGSHLVGVPDCGHMCTMEQPEAVTAALAAWLDY
jgi:pimeloyl-ACP methyl ester carboxylesterase